MCGRFTMTYEDVEFIAAGLGVPVESLNLYRPRYNVAPTDLHPIMLMKYEERQIEFAKWGLVNWWAKDASQAARQINARSERLESSPAFREAFKKHRCAVLSDGFFEWTGPKNDRKPLWFHRPDGGLVLMAGLYESWQVKPNEYQMTFTIVTTQANDLMAPVHDRMPVILDGEAVDEWIDPKNEDTAALKRLFTPVRADALIATPVSQRLNNVRFDERAGLFEPQQASLL